MIRPGLGGQLRGLLSSPGAIDLEQALAKFVINELQSHPDNIVLVFDDHQVVSDLEIHRAVDWLLEHIADCRTKNMASL